MDIGKVFPSRYLKVADLNGREVAVVIKDVKLESVGKGQEAKPVAFFRGTDKGLVLNVTNSKRIASIAGTQETDAWVGTRIVLYGTETEFQGDTVECIRVRVPKLEKPAAPVKKQRAKAKSVEELDTPIPPPAEPVEEVAEEAFDPDLEEPPF